MQEACMAAASPEPFLRSGRPESRRCTAHRQNGQDLQLLIKTRCLTLSRLVAMHDLPTTHKQLRFTLHLVLLGSVKYLTLMVL